MDTRPIPDIEHDPTPDYTTKPYAQFLEEAIPAMVQYDPVSIGLAFILPDGSIGTNYFNCDCTDLVLMANAINKDEMMSWMKVNRDVIMEEWEKEDGEEDDPSDPSDPLAPLGHDTEV